MTDTRMLIQRAALELAAEQGVSATSVDEIAAAAGVAKGSVFYNFGSKSVLFETILSEGVQSLTGHLRDAVGDRTGRAALDAVVAELLARVQERPAFAKFAVAEMFRTGRDWQDSIREVREHTITVIADLVAESWPERDPALSGAAIFGATVVTGLVWLVFEPDRELADVHAAIMASLT